MNSLQHAIGRKVTQATGYKSALTLPLNRRFQNSCVNGDATNSTSVRLRTSGMIFSSASHIPSALSFFNAFSFVLRRTLHVQGTRDVLTNRVGVTVMGGGMHTQGRPIERIITARARRRDAESLARIGSIKCSVQESGSQEKCLGYGTKTREALHN